MFNNRRFEDMMVEKSEYCIAIIGTGFVGLTTGAGLSELGNKVICVDIDEGKISSLSNGYVPIYEEGLFELVERNRKLHRLFFTTDIEEATNSSDIIFICVGTPSKDDGDVDLSQIISAVEGISNSLNSYKIIAIKSTIPVGTLELVEGILGKKDKIKGRDYDLAVVPEFLREGKAVYDFFNPTRIVIGADKDDVSKVLAGIFSPLNAPVVYTTPLTAQLIKYASNAFLASRISFINEIANICDHLGINVKDVIEGMKYDKRIGGHYLSPGIGFGGPCLSKDLNGLIKMAESYGYQPNYLKSIMEKNSHQISYVIDKLDKLLGGFRPGTKIGILGLTFKPDTNDVRNSLSIRIIKEIRERGAGVRAYDPKGMEEAKKYISDIIFCSDLYEAAKDSDALLILTAWDEFKEIDLERIRSTMKNPIIVDGVNILDPAKVKRFGFLYEGIGVR
ncbi:MAG TPA: UDP-glucose/GDP-mannose dehydrogenase family protein [bacterium]|nr:UDP-glucose/GDP-mannose dehydrogenase family protein [bacterium]